MISKLISINPELAGMISVVICVSIYVACKAVLWWLIMGTGHLIFGKLTFSEWQKKTFIGLVWGAIIASLNALLIYFFSPDNNYYVGSLVVALLLAFRIIWREFFTLFGLLRGDWHPLHPKLRFFAWNTFNVFVIFKPFKLIFSSPSKSSEGGFSLADLFYVKSEEVQQYEDACWQQRQNQERGFR